MFDRLLRLNTLTRIRRDPEGFGMVVGSLVTTLLVGVVAASIASRLDGVLGCCGWLFAAGCLFTVIDRISSWSGADERSTTVPPDHRHDRFHHWADRRQHDARKQSRRASELRVSPRLRAADDHSHGTAATPRAPRTFRCLVRTQTPDRDGTACRKEFTEYVIASDYRDAERAMRHRYPHPHQIFLQDVQRGHS